MGKKKKPKPKPAVDAQEANDELLALESIFAQEFSRHADGHGFSLTVLPHPGDAEINFISVDLEVRYSIQPADVTSSAVKN